MLNSFGRPDRQVFERPYPGESSKLSPEIAILPDSWCMVPKLEMYRPKTAPRLKGLKQTAQKAASKGEARCGRMHVTGCEMLDSTGISIPERLDLEDGVFVIHC